MGYGRDLTKSDRKVLDEIIQQAKTMENEQHSNTWIDSRTQYKGDDYIGKEMSFEDYFKQVYGNK